jgi:hypothetical protein
MSISRAPDTLADEDDALCHRFKEAIIDATNGPVNTSASKKVDKTKGVSRRNEAPTASVQAGVISFEAVQLRQEARMKAKGRGKLSRSAAARAAAAFDASDSSRGSGSSDGESDQASSRRGGKHLKSKGTAQRKGKIDRGSGRGAEEESLTIAGRHAGGNSKVKCYFCGRRGHVQEQCPG